MTTELFRKYMDIINEADAGPVSQEELGKLYGQGSAQSFIKNTPVALLPLDKLQQAVGPEKAKEIVSLAGLVDKTSYDEAWKNKGYFVFQWNSNKNEPDIYIADPSSIASRYTKFDGELPTDAKARNKIPSLVVLDKLGVDAEKMPFYVKKVPQEMISVDDIGLGGKTIEVDWGGGPSTQTVQPGGYLTKNENGMIYTVAPDAQGLPIGYIKA